VRGRGIAETTTTNDHNEQQQRKTRTKSQNMKTAEGHRNNTDKMNSALNLIGVVSV